MGWVLEGPELCVTFYDRLVPIQKKEKKMLPLRVDLGVGLPHCS